jgi:hypothetical protein
VTEPRFSEDIRISLADEQHAFDQFERSVARWPQRFREARAAARHEERTLRETGLITARRQASHLAASMAIRIIDLGSGLIVLVNSRNPHAAYATARALVETCGVFSYVRQNVLPSLRKGRVQKTEETLGRLRVGLDPGIKFDKSDRAAPIRVSKLVSALCAHVDEHLAADEHETAGETMAQLYSVLSDNTHPNMSAGHLSVTFDDDGYMEWAVGYAWDAGELHSLIGTCYLALHYASAGYDELMQTLTAHRLVLADKGLAERR